MARFSVFFSAREKVRVTVNLDEVKLAVAAVDIEGMPEDARHGTVLVLNLPPDGWDGSLFWTTLMHKGTAIRVTESISEVLQVLDVPDNTDNND